MKKINIEQAVGIALYHDITAMRDAFKDAAFMRGYYYKRGYPRPVVHWQTHCVRSGGKFR